MGAGAFGLISILSAVSVSAEMLIVSRALLGVAGATIAPSTLSLIFNMFKDPGQRARAIAIWISAFSAGSAIGPIVGGILLEYFWWGSVFLIAPERAGAASGISETAVELGGALNISVLGSLGVAIYRGDLTNLPADLPAEAATTARDTLGGAVQVAASLPESVGLAVLDVSRSAFVQAMQVAATISAVVAFAVAIIAITTLRHVPSGGLTEATDSDEPKMAMKTKVFTDMDCFGRTRGAVNSPEPQAAE